MIAGGRLRSQILGLKELDKGLELRITDVICSVKRKELIAEVYEVLR